MSRFEANELIELVAELAEKFTSRESTSITYEMAEQLMEAVNYCIEEEWNISGQSVLFLEEETAKQAYENGYGLVAEKTRAARLLYDQLLEDFKDYGNKSCYDTVIKGMPQFFLYYDAKFNPQDQILTLDYPTIGKLEKLRGIDAIYQYLQNMSFEKEFLKEISEEKIRRILIHYHNDYEELIINVCSIVMKNVLLDGIRNLAGKELTLPEAVKEFAGGLSQSNIEKKLLFLLKMVLNRYQNGNKILDYLKEDLPEFSFELDFAIKKDNWNRIYSYAGKS